MGTKPLSKKGRSPIQFLAHVYYGQTSAWIKMPLDKEPRPTRHCVQCGPRFPRKKGTPTPTQFLAHVCCGQMAEWMKTPLGTEVDLGLGHIVSDEDPAPPPAKEAQQPPLFGPCLLWPLSPISATTELLLLKVRYRPLSPFTRCLLHYCASTKAGSSSNTMWPGSRPTSMPNSS